MPKKIIITGASGFVGRQLVPRLEAAGCTLLLVGRNEEKLRKQFPNLPNCNYDNLAQQGMSFDILVHLAVLNNDAKAAPVDFQRVNVDFLKETLVAMKQAEVKRIVNVTTFHSIGTGQSDYANSKRDAVNMLQKETEFTVTNLYLPAVYGDEFAGKLAVVKKLPRPVRSAALMVLSALVPTVHIDKLVNFLLYDLEAAPQNVMLSNAQESNLVYVWGKRFVDILFAVAVIGLAGWLLVIVWALVKIGSSGPGIFAQNRLGMNRVHFVCYKFRTMKIGTKQTGTHEVTADAITGIGSFLRKTKIDELPQVFNILRGELSLIGPRPGLPVQTELTEARQARNIFSVLPGITGLAQINGVDMSDPVRLANLDAQYISQRGLLMELKILAATFLGHGQGDKIRK